MKIGIIGSNDRAVAIGRLLASGGHEVTMSDPESPQHGSERAAAKAGTEAEIPYRQAMTREMIVFAIPRQQVDTALTAVGSGVEAHAVVDAMEGPPLVRNGASGAELLARKLNSHYVVRALIVLPQAGANIPICGDDAMAKTLVDEAIKACGCVTTDRGPLSNADELETPRPAERGTIEGRMTTLRT